SSPRSVSSSAVFSGLQSSLINCFNQLYDIFITKNSKRIAKIAFTSFFVSNFDTFGIKILKIKL
ncbi:MAG TPA: hypothetical protein DEG69_05950, partial [Flavobacteriaceae bacterium]|nr:hypothetical protein [Flavobacteriaceae bacterium]